MRAVSSESSPTDSLVRSVAFAEVKVGQHQVAILRDGAQAYPAMLAAIAQATSTLCLETYILRDDATGARFAEALCARAQAGVEVNVMYDAWGSDVSPAFLERLHRAGVRTLSFRPLRFFGTRLGAALARLRRRNHRKALVVDGRVAFTGGMNIADEYAAATEGGGNWRDTQVRLEGPAAKELERLFLETWRRHRGAPLELARYARWPQPRDGQVHIISNDFGKGRKGIRKAYADAIGKARVSIHLTQAYFLPPSRIVRLLQKAARRGVDVRIVLAAATDVKLVLLGARALYGRLLKSGVRVFEWRGRVLHAKTAVVDGRWTTIGSANLDALSLRANLEVNAVFEDEALGTAAERLFAEDVAACEEMTLAKWKARPWPERLLSWFAYQLRNWL